MSKIEFFVNDRYLVLKTLYEHQIEINDTKICPITQQEIADALGFSKTKVNNILNELIGEYVEIYNNTKGRYQLTEQALAVLKVLNKGQIKM